MEAARELELGQYHYMYSIAQYYNITLHSTVWKTRKEQNIATSTL